MTRRATTRCAYCFETVPYDGPRVLKIDIVEPRCAVTLRWCIACAHADPLSEALAEAERVEVGPGDEHDPFQQAYIAILDRAAARDVALLPGVADVRRDIDEVLPTGGGRVTLRAPGASWGRPTVVPKHGVARWP